MGAKVGHEKEIGQTIVYVLEVFDVATILEFFKYIPCVIKDEQLITAFNNSIEECTY